MTVLILGAGGIIGQHIRLMKPTGVTAIFARRHADAVSVGVDLADEAERHELLATLRPNVIINLAGEASPDIVEREPEKFYAINVEIPELLARWCQRNNAHFIHVSSQSVFSGNNPPYRSDSERNPVNRYGAQKLEAEQRIERIGSNWSIIRPTFVLGVRPIPGHGRKNPVEQILEGQPKQVSDRLFSVSCADEVAAVLWDTAMSEPTLKAQNVGGGTYSRLDIARILDCPVTAVTHEEFDGLAARPLNTTYVAGGVPEAESTRVRHIRELTAEYRNREAMTLKQRASELSIFTGRKRQDCEDKLRSGFHPLHAEVRESFNAAAPKTDAELLAWYRKTDTYIWELSAYHCDAGVPEPGWNYFGMCDGIAERLLAADARRVLCLGDGIGDLSLVLAGIYRMNAVYHDLRGSVTARFAEARFQMYGVLPDLKLTADWTPELGSGEFDAIVSLDFLEHVTDVQGWVEAIKKALRPSGLFCAQNAFGIGSGDEGSIPMHLTRNDRYEKEWDPLLYHLGFEQLSSNWYRRLAAETVQV